MADLTNEAVQRLIDKLEEDSGISAEDMMENAVYDGVSAAICTNPDCEAISEDMEPDQREGHCEECHQQTVQSILVLKGMI